MFCFCKHHTRYDMKIDCGIVQDLIPSYVDGVCSEASKQCVEEHIKECEECRTFLEGCRTVELSGEALEEQQLDGLRKVKKKLKLQNMFSYGLLLIVIGFATYFFTTNIGAIGVRWYYGLYVVAVAATFVVTMQGKANEKYEKIEKIMAGMSLVAIAYAMFWYCFIMGYVSKGNVPLGLEIGQVGEFLHWHTGLALTVELAVFAYTMVRYLKWDVVCRGTLLISLTGLFFILAQTTLLGRLSELETHMRNFTEAAVVMLGAGAVCGVVLWGMKRRRKKQAR